MKLTIKLDKESGVRYQYEGKTRLNNYIVPWMTGGYACFNNGSMVVVMPTLARARKYLNATY